MVRILNFILVEIRNHWKVLNGEVIGSVLHFNTITLVALNYISCGSDEWEWEKSVKLLNSLKEGFPVGMLVL